MLIKFLCLAEFFFISWFCLTSECLFSFVFQNIVISSAAERVSPRFFFKSEQFEDLSVVENTALITH